ncbi:hypothetical protein BH23ACT12_BH23ACT12_04170 [soil metagenome]
MSTVFRPILPLLAVLSLLAACGRDNPTLEAPTGSPQALSVNITSPQNGAQVAGNVVVLTVESEGLEITDADGDISGEAGHYHVLIDRDPVAAGETISDDPEVIHFSEDTVAIPGLSAGKHKFTVVLGDASESRIGRGSAVIELEVTGPSIDATAPKTAPMAVGFTVETAVSSVQIVDPARDPGTGGTGHLDLVIDPRSDPFDTDKPLPADSSHIHSTGTSTEVTGLIKGEHTVWVVLSDKNHVPVKPPVADRVVVEIR